MKSSQYFGMEYYWGLFDKDPNLKTVTAFVDGIKDRIRITRIRKRDRDYCVTFGKANYVERQWFKRHKDSTIMSKSFPKKRK